jgi:hypothetical protein
MRRNQDRRHRKVQEPRHLAERARLESARLAAEEADQAALGEASPGQRRRGPGWFEKIQPHPAPTTAAPAAGGEPHPGTLVQVPAPRRPLRAWLPSALAAMLAVGMVLGFAVGSARSGGETTSAPATRARDPAGSAPQTSVVVRPVASSACLETARRGDQLIGLLISNQRSQAADLLVAYTVASRQCRKDASP